MTAPVVGEPTAPGDDAALVARSPLEPVDLLLRELRSRRSGLASRQAQARLERFGPNELRRRGGRRWPRELLAQAIHPLAALLWAAAALAFIAGSPALGWAIIAVVVINAGFAFAQERQAERAVEALSGYLPQQATVLRDGRRAAVDARTLVPGDVLVVEEGDRISADARLIDGAVEVDMSTLTGESAPQSRNAEPVPATVPLLEATDLLFSGTACTSGNAHAVVYATGSRTELGRIAALSERVRREESPLEKQVRRVAWLIAGVAVLAGAVFLPLGLLAGWSLHDAFVFAIGILVANVPEGLLPTITLALALGVRVLARRGAVVKRLSAVETLGSTTVICTDKTGTLTENRMHVVATWCGGHELRPGERSPATLALSQAMVTCTAADADATGAPTGDATEVAVVEQGIRLGGRFDPAERERARQVVFRFDPARKLMSTVDQVGGHGVVSVKGAPEAVLAASVGMLAADGGTVRLDAAARADVAAVVDAYASAGLRVIAVAGRDLDRGERLPQAPEQAERALTLLGLVAMLDPPREQVADAVDRCHQAGIRVHVVTGDHLLTAAAVARRVGIGDGELRTVAGAVVDAMTDEDLDRLLSEPGEIVFARSSPETKLRVAQVLRDAGDVVAMTGDGVNDAPALRCADIGVAMGRAGTDVAREAATMVLTDDNFATIVRAVEAGRRVWDNVRKFVLYIFAHAVPEVVPFLVFALSGGAVPLPLTVLQILAIDLGTETLPALALGRERPEPGLMQRPPRGRREPLVNGALLLRAWGYLGIISAGLAMLGFFYVLWRAGWHPGDAVGSGAPLHEAYVRATTATFAGIVACQVGTAFAARTDRASLRAIGVFTNPMLLWGIAFELAFTAALVYLPPLQELFGTAALPGDVLVLLATFPVLVWGSDELRRAHVRRRRPMQGPSHQR